MSSIPAQYKVPPRPQVNLIPPEVAARRAKSQRRVMFSLLAFIVVGAIVAGYLWLNTFIHADEARAQAEQQRTAELQAELASLSEVDAVKAKLANADSARKTAAAIEFFWPLILSAVDGAVPDDARIESFTFSAPDFGGDPPGPGSAFDIPGVAGITLTVDVPAASYAIDLENRLNAVPFFDRARATQVWAVRDSGEGGGEGAIVSYLVEISVTVTYDALMMRHSDLWYGTGGDNTTRPLEDYYRAYLRAILEGGSLPGYPELPDVERPVFVPGAEGILPGAPGDAGATDPAANGGEGVAQ